MKKTLLALFVLAPTLALGQSLAEVAKKEKTRREKNKQEGKQVQVLSESDLPEDSEASSAEASAVESTTVPSLPPAPLGPRETTPSVSSDENVSEEDSAVPAFIPPDRPLPEKLEMFERMKRQYERQAKEIDEALAKNDARLQELEAEIGATSALRGAGLPVAPQTGTGAANRQMTGQESVALVGEQNQLQAANAQLRARKEELKANLIAKGRAANIPPGYLRF